MQHERGGASAHLDFNQGRAILTVPVGAFLGARVAVIPDTLRRLNIGRSRTKDIEGEIPIRGQESVRRSEGCESPLVIGKVQQAPEGNQDAVVLAREVRRRELADPGVDQTIRCRFARLRAQQLEHRFGAVQGDHAVARPG